MIERDKLPEDAVDWKGVTVDFPRLADDTEESCPESRSEIMGYVRMESADAVDATEESLKFHRTALVGKDKCWLWIHTESDGEVCYVTFWKKSNGGTLLGLSGANGLSPEQYMLAEYYEEVYW